MKQNLAIIPARSGSKGLKNKNIKLLCGKPLLAYSIEAAKESGLFDDIILSTDSTEYAKIGIDYGAEVPFLRSEMLSSDKAGSWDVVKDVCKQLESRGQQYNTVTLLQPTSPLRSAKDICGAMNYFNVKNAQTVISVCEMDHSPLWSNMLPDDRNMLRFVPKEIVNMPRQEIPIYYRVNGAIYITRVTNLDKMDDVYDRDCYAYIMDKKKSIDIDDELDFYFAETILNSSMLT